MAGMDMLLSRYVRNCPLDRQVYIVTDKVFAEVIEPVEAAPSLHLKHIFFAWSPHNFPRS
jgi:hypothetical protein